MLFGRKHHLVVTIQRLFAPSKRFIDNERAHNLQVTSPSTRYNVDWSKNNERENDDDAIE